MKLSAIGPRMRPSLIAVAAGWAAAMAITLPMQLVKVYVSNVGDFRELLWSYAVGSLIWAMWTLAIVAGGWLCGALPLIAIVREDWMLRHHGRSVAIVAALGWLVVLIEFQVWTLVLPNHTLSVRIFVLYSLVFVIFPAVAVAVYIGLIARRNVAAGHALHS